MSRTLLICLVLSQVFSILACPGCRKKDPKTAGKKSGPVFETRMTNDMLPPDLKDLIVGQATEKQVGMRFPGASVKRDKRLGGDGTVSHNDNPAVSYQFGGMYATKSIGRYCEGSALLVKEGDGPPILSNLQVSMHTDKGSLCDWVKKKISNLKGARNCEDTYFSHEESEKSMTYCLGTFDGKAGVAVSCRRHERMGKAMETLRYTKSVRN